MLNVFNIVQNTNIGQTDKFLDLILNLFVSHFSIKEVFQYFLYKTDFKRNRFLTVIYSKDFSIFLILFINHGRTTRNLRKT